MRADRRRPRRRSDRRPLSRAARAAHGCTCAATRLARAARRARSPTRDVERILRGLGLDRRRRPPTAGTSSRRPFRVDLLREVDLIEEVGRHYGFDKLDADLPGRDARRRRRPIRAFARDRLVRRVLTAAGLSEA